MRTLHKNFSTTVQKLILLCVIVVAFHLLVGYVHAAPTWDVPDTQQIEGSTGATGGDGSTGATGGEGSTGATSGGTSGGVTGGGSGVQIFDPLNKSITQIFLAILDIIMVFAVPIVLFFIVWAGFLYVTARGDTTQLEKATRALTYAIIGGVIVFGSYALLSIIENTINAFK